jgi:uncharacterized protein (TIGR03067 family)
LVVIACYIELVTIQFKVREESSMKSRGCLACALLLLIAGGGRAGEGEMDLEKLQGDWVAIFHEFNGIPFKTGEFGRVEITIKEDKWISHVGYKSTFTVILNPKADPKQIDKTCLDTKGPFAGKVFLGIYKIDGDLLTICGNSGGKNRPATFSTKGETDFKLYIFKRVHP